MHGRGFSNTNCKGVRVEQACATLVCEFSIVCVICSLVNKWAVPAIFSPLWFPQVVTVNAFWSSESMDVSLDAMSRRMPDLLSVSRWCASQVSRVAVAWASAKGNYISRQL